MIYRDPSHCAEHLLNREPPPEYVEEWEKILKKEKDRSHRENSLSVLVFRMGSEWFALETCYVHEVCAVPIIHSVPRVRTPYLQGVANVRGRLRVCVSLKGLLQVDEDPSQSEKGYPRLLVLKEKYHVFVSLADEVFGIQDIKKKEVGNVPSTLEGSMENYLKGMIPWRNFDVGLLDEGLLFPSLLRSVKA